MLAIEKMDVFRVSLEVCEEVSRIVPRRGHADLRDQITRASSSVVLNIAEGAGRRAAGDKRRFYEIALGSAQECLAVVLVFRAIRAVDGEQLRDRIVRVIPMLNRLIARFHAD